MLTINIGNRDALRIKISFTFKRLLKKLRDSTTPRITERDNESPPRRLAFVGDFSALTNKNGKKERFDLSIAFMLKYDVTIPIVIKNRLYER